MATLDINKINLGKLSEQLRRYERQWVAISERNEIVASGRTYGETVRKVKRPEKVVLFKVPPMDYSLALEQEPAVAPGGTSRSFDAKASIHPRYVTIHTLLWLLTGVGEVPIVAHEPSFLDSGPCLIMK